MAWPAVTQAVNLFYLKVVGSIELLDNIRHNATQRNKHNRGHKHTGSQSDQALSGKTVIITGGNAGVGRATAEVLAARGAHVVLACRSLERGQFAAEQTGRVAPLPGCSQAKVEVLELDLECLDSVKRFAQRFNARRQPLDLLICNAGIMAPPERLETPDGMEQQFQVNYLSHWLLTHNLLAEQRQRRRQHLRNPSRHSGQVAAQHESREGTRVLMLSSLTHKGGRLKFDDLQARRSYHGLQRYTDSKLAAVLAAKEFQRRFDRNADGDIVKDTAVAVDPGVLDTYLARTYFATEVPGFLKPFCMGFLERRVFPWILLPPYTAAETVLWAATAPRAQVMGAFVKNSKVAKPSRRAEDEAVARRLWDVSCQLTDTTTSPSLR